MSGVGGVQDAGSLSEAVIDEAVVHVVGGEKGLSSERFKVEDLREWVRQVTAEEELLERWPVAWSSFVCCPDLPEFAVTLADLCEADLPDEFLEQVQAWSEHYPPFDPPEDPAEQAAWIERAEAEVSAFMRTLPADLW